MPAAALTEGVDEHLIDGVPVHITGVARTVADCFKNRSWSLRSFLRTRPVPSIVKAPRSGTRTGIGYEPNSFSGTVCSSGITDPAG